MRMVVEKTWFYPKSTQMIAFTFNNIIHVQVYGNINARMKINEHKDCTINLWDCRILISMLRSKLLKISKENVTSIIQAKFKMYTPLHC